MKNLQILSVGMIALAAFIVSPAIVTAQGTGGGSGEGCENCSSSFGSGAVEFDSEVTAPPGAGSGAGGEDRVSLSASEMERMMQYARSQRTTVGGTLGQSAVMGINPTSAAAMRGLGMNVITIEQMGVKPQPELNSGDSAKDQADNVDIFGEIGDYFTGLNQDLSDTEDAGKVAIGVAQAFGFGTAQNPKSANSSGDTDGISYGRQRNNHQAPLVVIGHSADSSLNQLESQKDVHMESETHQCLKNTNSKGDAFKVTYKRKCINASNNAQNHNVNCSNSSWETVSKSQINNGESAELLDDARDLNQSKQNICSNWDNLTQVEPLGKYTEEKQHLVKELTAEFTYKLKRMVEPKMKKSQYCKSCICRQKRLDGEVNNPISVDDGTAEELCQQEDEEGGEGETTQEQKESLTAYRTVVASSDFAWQMNQVGPKSFSELPQGDNEEPVNILRNPKGKKINVDATGTNVGTVSSELSEAIGIGEDVGTVGEFAAGAFTGGGNDSSGGGNGGSGGTAGGGTQQQACSNLTPQTKEVCRANNCVWNNGSCDAPSSTKQQACSNFSNNRSHCLANGCSWNSNDGTCNASSSSGGNNNSGNNNGGNNNSGNNNDGNDNGSGGDCSAFPCKKLGPQGKDCISITGCKPDGGGSDGPSGKKAYKAGKNIITGVMDTGERLAGNVTTDISYTITTYGNMRTKGQGRILGNNFNSGTLKSETEVSNDNLGTNFEHSLTASRSPFTGFDVQSATMPDGLGRSQIVAEANFFTRRVNKYRRVGSNSGNQVPIINNSPEKNIPVRALFEKNTKLLKRPSNQRKFQQKLLGQSGSGGGDGGGN